MLSQKFNRHHESRTRAVAAQPRNNLKAVVGCLGLNLEQQHGNCQAHPLCYVTLVTSKGLANWNQIVQAFMAWQRLLCKHALWANVHVPGGKILTTCPLVSDLAPLKAT